VRVLVLGGTTFLSAAIAELALDAGDEVVCLARGDSGGFPLGVTSVVADRRWGPVVYRALEGTFDFVVEVATQPSFVDEALRELGARAGHWTYVSSCSVYARHDQPWADETAELSAPLTEGDGDEAYPGLKSRSEAICRERVGDRLHVLRPGLLVGPGDPSDRFGYWPARLSRDVDAPVVVPDSPDSVVQLVDVRDVAEWVLRSADEGLVGVHNVGGPSTPLVEVLESVADVCGFAGDFLPVPESVLSTYGVTAWSGPDSIPLWLPEGGEYEGFARRDISAAFDAGLDVRRLAETVRDVVDDEVARGLWRERRAGLRPTTEQRLAAAAEAGEF
jgi:nucleoside-diphosphate-sugar epimerase